MKTRQKIQEKIDVAEKTLLYGSVEGPSQIERLRSTIKQGKKEITTPEPPSEAQIVLGKGKLLNERPAGMNFAVYRYLRAYQSKVLKNLFRGPANLEIARAMRPRVDSLHLQNEVMNARYRKAHPESETPASDGFFNKLFNKLRSKWRVTF